MPAYPSRTRRPERPAPLELTDRDRAVLVSVFRHRYLASRHVHALHFDSSSLRAAQRRLRRLWTHGMLDRVVIPSIAIGTDGAPRQNRQHRRTHVDPGSVALVPPMLHAAAATC